MNFRPSQHRGFHFDDAAHTTVVWWLLGAIVVLSIWWLYLILPTPEFRGEALLVIGFIGVWRYLWKALHLFRGLYYRYVRYPALSRLIDPTQKPTELLIVIPSYRTAPEISTQVFNALVREIDAFGVACRVVACVTDAADVNIIRSQWDTLRTHVPVTLHIIDQDGTGKRNALADALELLAKGRPIAKDAVLVLMDGDSVVPEGIFSKVSGFFLRYHDLGALTTHNASKVSGSSLKRQWYRQRMAQRHFFMNSLSLNYGLLTLTGRFSVFRASLALSPEFIEGLRHDQVDHWRAGRIRFLTGDDKSTWFHVLKTRWKMMYLPDTVVTCLEEAPEGSFVSSSLSLMTRWYGNMVRSNLRAIRLKPWHTGWFLWLCLLDQRISVWTTLSGPFMALFLTAVLGPQVLVAYLLWVVLTRSVHGLLLWAQSGQFHPLFIPLLWYDQMAGSLVKVYLLLKPERQRWTRQNIKAARSNDGLVLWFRNALPKFEFTAAMSGLLVFVMLLYG